MTGRQQLPDRTTLAAWVAEDLSYREMADRLYETTGQVVTIQAFAQALKRYGLIKEPRQVRHDDLLPWVVTPRHTRLVGAKMLRLEARRRKGMPVSEKDVGRLES